MTDPYMEKGYTDRVTYLESLITDGGYESNAVYALADLLGSDEDFDALPLALDDYL